MIFTINFMGLLMCIIHAHYVMHMYVVMDTSKISHYAIVDRYYDSLNINILL